MFGTRFSGTKVKTQLRLCMARIKLLRNKRELQVKQLKKEIADLLASGKEPAATIRVEHVLREEATMQAYDVIELFCELIVVRLPIIESQRDCPFDLKEAISSLVFAAPRCSDLPELQQVRALFQAKYDKEFVAAASELRPACGVNRRLIEKMSIRPPGGEVKLKMLKDIAELHKVQWDSAASEQALAEPREDLLEGYNPAIRPGANDLPEIITKLPANPNPNPPQLRPNPDQPPPARLHPGANDRPGTSHGVTSPASSDRQFVPFAVPVANPHTDPLGFSASDREPTHKSKPSELYKDAAAAAAAAADSAEKAAAAARAAARLAGMPPRGGGNVEDAYPPAVGGVLNPYAEKEETSVPMARVAEEPRRPTSSDPRRPSSGDPRGPSAIRPSSSNTSIPTASVVSQGDIAQPVIPTALPYTIVQSQPANAPQDLYGGEDDPFDRPDSGNRRGSRTFGDPYDRPDSGSRRDSRIYNDPYDKFDEYSGSRRGSQSFDPFDKPEEGVGSRRNSKTFDPERPSSGASSNGFGNGGRSKPGGEFEGPEDESHEFDPVSIETSNAYSTLGQNPFAAGGLLPPPRNPDRRKLTTPPKSPGRSAPKSPGRGTHRDRPTSPIFGKAPEEYKPSAPMPPPGDGLSDLDARFEALKARR